MGFSAFTLMYAVVEPLLRPPGLCALQRTQFDLVDELLRAFHFGRNTTAFVRQSFAPVLVSDTWLLTTFEARQQEDVRGLDARFPQFQPLLACIEALSDPSQKMVCLLAVSQLIHRIATLVDNPGEPEQTKIIWEWSLEVNQDFLDMCSARHSVALATVAHFAVLMSFYREHWCVRFWPAGLLAHIRGMLGHEWEDAVQWLCDVIKEFPDSYAMPLLRRLVAQIVAHLFGPEHATAALEAPTQATSPHYGLRLLATWNLSVIDDKETGLDFAAGRWKDVHGDEGHGPIDAYKEDPRGRVLISPEFQLSLTRGVLDAAELKKMNPRVLRFDLVRGGGAGESGHKLAFEVREYTEYIRKYHVNATLAVPMGFSDAPSAAVHQSP